MSPTHKRADVKKKRLSPGKIKQIAKEAPKHNPLVWEKTIKNHWRADFIGGDFTLLCDEEFGRYDLQIRAQGNFWEYNFSSIREAKAQARVTAQRWLAYFYSKVTLFSR